MEHVMLETPITRRLDEIIPAIRSMAARLDGHSLSELTVDRVEAIVADMNYLLKPIVTDVRRTGQRSVLNTMRGSLIDYIGRGRIQDRMISKPRGYSGDYLTIDWLYQQPFDGDHRVDVWNRLSYAQQAARAVRARVDYVRDAILPILSAATTDIRILDIASGPGRIERGVFDAVPSLRHRVTFELLDADEDAIEYSRTLLSSAIPTNVDLQFHHRNALRFAPTSTYRFIWSAGLFDYLDDRLAARLLSRMYSWLDKGGSMLVGNFAPECQSQWSLEAFYDWFLIYRSEEDCLKLCEAAGIPFERIRLERDVTDSVVLMRVDAE